MSPDPLEGLTMFAKGVSAHRAGDRATAAQSFQKAAEAGHVEGYAALVQLAVDARDPAGEAHWARLGAEAGHPFCIARHGLLLLRSAMGRDDQERARVLLEQAAASGDVDSMVLAAHVNRELGDLARSRHFAMMAQQTSNATAIDSLRRYRLI